MKNVFNPQYNNRKFFSFYVLFAAIGLTQIRQILKLQQNLHDFFLIINDTTLNYFFLMDTWAFTQEEKIVPRI